MARRTTLALAAAALAALGFAGNAAALGSRPCAGQRGFRCATIRVPLDRSGAVPGTIPLHIAFEPSRPGHRAILMALSGGPGQGSVDTAESWRLPLSPALRHRRLVLVDQRGTGRSGALECGRLQRLSSAVKVPPRLVGDCGGKLGRARAFYATADSVLDLDAVRAALGAPRMEVMGISYGTFVAAQYARTFPDHTDGLILDSVVDPDGLDPYLRSTYEALPRILREQCAGGRCRQATHDPVRDLARMTARLQRGAVHGVRFDASGLAHVEAVANETELVLLVMTGDLNPFLQPALPGAIGAALDGDPALLMRLRHLADGGPEGARGFSAALNVATNCSDSPLPYSFAMPYADRRTAWQHGLDGVPPESYAPFSRQAVLDTALAHDCLLWPGDPLPKPPSRAPLPDVPTIVLSGRLDTRTPLEGARRVAARFPRGSLVVLPGSGHDVLDSDVTGCAATALGRWAAGRAVGDPCRRKDNSVAPYPRPPRRLDEFRSAPGVGGSRGRLVFATLDTIADAQVTALQTLYSGFAPLRGGGLRGGRFTADDNVERVGLDRYSFVEGVALSGRLRVLGNGAAVGMVRVDGPGRLDGRLTLGRHGAVSGRLGGRTVRYRPRSGRVRAASWSSGRVPQRVSWPSLRERRAARARWRGSVPRRP